jgi:hypothetical protein
MTTVERATVAVYAAGGPLAMLVGLGARIMTSRLDDLTDSDDEMHVAMWRRWTCSTAVSWPQHGP